MTWKPSGATAIKSGNFHIAKCAVGGFFRYVLYLGPEPIGVFDSADEAKAAAKRRDDEEMAGAA